MQDALDICMKAMEEFACGIASIPVDNAARGVAAELCKRLGGMTFVSRDPAHSLDLLSKDLVKTLVVKSVMAEAKEVRDFVKIDRIDSIRLEAAESGELEQTWTAVNMVDTRMNLSYDFIKAARLQHDFVKLLWGNEAFQQYFKERSNKVQESTRAILERCSDNNRWERMDVLMSSLLVHFKKVHGLCCRENFPLSCYPLLVQGLRNDLNKGLNVDNGKFDVILGEGSRKEVADMIRERFNMDGRDPSGRKVGLLDRKDLMCFLVDPFSWEWRSRFFLQTSMAELVTEMIEHFIPLDADGSSESQERVNKEYQVRSCLSLLIYKYKLYPTTRLSLCYRNSTHTRVTGSTPSQKNAQSLFAAKSCLKIILSLVLAT